MSKDQKNEDKEQPMLNRWVNMKREQSLGEIVRRPGNPLDVESLQMCMNWRGQVMFEVAKLVTDIQNAGLGENRIRSMNDEINKLLREKQLWEDRIRQLGGPDLKKVIARQVDSQGQEIPGAEGYMYFGAAKDLPGVAELLTREKPSAPAKNKALLLSMISTNYYESVEDEQLLRLEREAEEKLAAEGPYKRQKVADPDDDSFVYLIEGNAASRE
jgi:pre-mRNA-splicing factor ISY1